MDEKNDLQLQAALKALCLTNKEGTDVLTFFILHKM